MPATSDVMERIVALCKRRGFIFQSSEIYGGIGGFWDYGPLGCELKRNVKDAWWHDMVRNPPLGPGGREYQMVGVDCSIIMNPKVWEASGHATGFADPMVDCKAEGCKGRFRADKVFVIELIRPEDSKDWQELKQKAKQFGLPVDGPAGTPLTTTVEADSIEGALVAAESAVSNLAKTANLEKWKKATCVRFPAEMTHLHHNFIAIGKENSMAFGNVRPIQAMESVKTRCPRCLTEGSLTEPRSFNLMLKTYIGALQDDSSQAYLRPETAQGIFANFQNVYDTSRVKIPFGIAQIGKAFRNEINPRNFTFRSREFEQMEIEFFCKPEESMAWYEFWRDVRINWYTSLGIKSDKLRPRQQGEKELAHYSKACTDIEYLFPFSDEPQELEGVAHRGSFDLNQHGKFAKGKEDAFAVLDDDVPPQQGAGARRYVPHVIEPSAGADRFTLAVICEAYSYDESRASPEFMKFHPRLAPIKAAVFPLVAKDGLPEIAEPIYREIKKHYPAQYDAKQSIGKRYARMDEAGTPFCFTIDGQSKEDGTVTVRNRDDASQMRIDKSKCLAYLRDHLGAL